MTYVGDAWISEVPGRIVSGALHGGSPAATLRLGHGAGAGDFGLCREESNKPRTTEQDMRTLTTETKFLR